MNVTSGPAYGFTCEFLAGEDDLVLTKLSGGGCICQDQPAIYTIEGTLYCERGEDGTYSLRLVLYYKVPVYDETLTCPTPPCPEEPLWETWIWDYTLASGLSSSSAICDLGSSPIGPLGFNTDASAQTSCGLGLDGTDATVTVEWKFCDPLDGIADGGVDSGTGSANCYCCNEDDISNLPDQMQVILSGYEDNGFSATPCEDCALIDGTYVLERANGSCWWFGCFDVSPCTAAVPINKIGIAVYSHNATGWWPGQVKSPMCAMTLVVFGNTTGDCPPEDIDGWQVENQYLLGVFHDNSSHYESGGKCSNVDTLSLDSIPPDYQNVDNWWNVNGNVPGFWCGFQNATATITAIP